MASEVEFARPQVNRPETVCSRESKNAAVCGAAAQADLEQDMLHIMKCATVVRRDILDSVAQKWLFSGTLCEPDRHSRIPVSLRMLLKWILQGTGSGAEVHNEEIEQASVRLAQNIIFETKSNRQVSYQGQSKCRGAVSIVLGLLKMSRFWQ